ncbi:hypothetical protein LguiA_034186 [Lonicera macranthoides]
MQQRKGKEVMVDASRKGKQTQKLLVKRKGKERMPDGHGVYISSQSGESFLRLSVMDYEYLH